MNRFISQRHRSLGALAAPQRNKNKRRIIALGILFVLATIVFTWFSVQNKDFATKLQESTKQMRTAIAATPAKVKAAKDAGDTTAVSTVLKELSATMSQKSKSLPVAPNLIGIHIGADAERSKRQQLQITADAYATDLAALADFIDYQSSLARELQGLSLKDAAGYDQTIELANAWRETIQKVQTQTKPAQLTEVTATLLQKMEIAETTIREMAELYKKTDTDGFKTKKSQLAATISEFKVLGEQIGTIAAQLDAQVAASGAKLRQNL